MAPAMLHVLSELSALASNEDIKNAILTNYSDIPSTTEAATQLQNMQTSPNKPLVTFNHKYEAIHKVVFGLSPNQQENRTVIVEYAKKLPLNTRDKLLRKIAKKNSYIKTLDDAFKQAIEINRETSFVEAASGRYNDQNCTKIETQINELDDSFQDCDINAMNTRSTNRSGERPNKYQHHRNQHKAQIIFEFSDQNMIEMIQTVRGFINLIKANPTTRDQYKSNKLAVRKEYYNEVNESEIHPSNLDQVQQLVNEDTDLVFDALVAAGYIDEIYCADGICQQQA